MEYETERLRLGDLREMMMAKGFRRPDPALWMTAEKIQVYLGYDERFKDLLSWTHTGETFEDALQKAMTAVRSIPGPKEQSLDRYRKSLAETLKVAHEESIDDALVQPVHEAFTATTEALLPAPEAAE